jgi:ketosteroid isomerase-like protein
MPRRARLEVQSLELKPERVTLRGNSAVVIGLLHIKATVAGRALPDTMRVLSVFTKENDKAK